MRGIYSRTLLCLLITGGLSIMPAEGADRYIVRVNGGGAGVLQNVCRLLGCQVTEGVDGSLGQLFLVTTALRPAVFLTTILRQPVVVDVEQDLIASVADATYTVPPALSDSAPVDYYGTTVPHGYVTQPAVHILRLDATQRTFGVKGAGTVAVIDTGIDASHPTLRNSLVPGYDFTRNQDGEGDETGDVVLTHRPDTSSPQPYWTNGQSAALVDQSTASVVDGNPQYSDFGHGTMVAGVIHLAAPGAMLMPLKAFGSDGKGYTSDILRATYWAVQHQANIINMSFNLPGRSQEMKLAMDYATQSGVICVAAAGNQASRKATYPAAYNNVIGVASTTNDDQRSSFSNYGDDNVWVAAPGEGVVTTYPYSTYAAAWGTSFSAPFVSGVVALMLDENGSLLMNVMVSRNEAEAARAVAHARPMHPALGNGRLNSRRAVRAWRRIMSQP